MMRFRRLILGLIPTLCALSFLAFAATPAGAAVTHEYLPTLSAKLTAGAPKVGGLTVGSGETVGEPGELFTFETQGPTGNRLAKFSLSSGALVLQFPEVAGFSYYNGVAVSHSTGNVYLSADEEGGGSVAVFDAAGSLQKVWQGKETAGGGFGIFDTTGEGPMVAVDNSSNVETAGDVYVASEQNDVVDVFKPGAGGSEETKPVHEIGGVSPTEPFGRIGAVAVDEANGDVLVLDQRNSVVDVFKPALLGEYELAFQIAGTPSGTFQGGLRDVASGGGEGDGDIYVADGRGAVDQFSVEGVFLGPLTGISPAEPFGETVGAAVDPATGDVFVDDGGSAIDAFGPTIVIPDVKTEPATEVHATHVQLGGTVKLDKAGPAECFFEYGTSKAYGREAPCEPETVTEAEELPPGTPVPVKQTITGLLPDTQYFYRVRALNDNTAHISSTGEGSEDEGTFTTTGPGLHGEFSSEVASGAATLDATINPDGSPTHYYFQYNTTGTVACQATASASSCPAIPAPPGEALGSAAGDQNVSQRLQGLQPSFTYHYRVIVVSEPEPGVKEVFPEPDQTFTTQPAGTGFQLSDARQWELVSPPDKHGSNPEASGNEGVTQASLSGEAFTYVGTIPTAENAPGFFDGEQIIATRGPAGWSSRDISLPHHTPPGVPTYHKEYQFFSEDLSLGALMPFGTEFMSLKPEVFPPDTEKTPYLRHTQTCQATPSTCYEPLLTGAPGYADVPEGTNFGGEGETPQATVVGGTPDLSHVIVAGADVSATTTSLAEWSASAPPTERLRQVGVLPASEGSAPPGNNSAILGRDGNGLTDNARGAVSANGSRVVWTLETSNGKEGLYLRVNATEPQSAISAGHCTEPAKACTIRLDTVQGGSGNGTIDPVFQIANKDDSRILFSDSQQLLPGAGDLYECEVVAVSAEPSCALHDVAPGTGNVAGVLGASEDGSYVYFVSNGLKLYVVRHDAAAKSWEAPVLIATLSKADENDWGQDLTFQTARVSPDGKWLAFMSSRSLTGYDNRDAQSGQPDEEVYLYNGETHSLVCASCNPTGARPHGVLGHIGGGPEGPRLVDPTGRWSQVWFAANIPSWYGDSSVTPNHQPRYLSDSGRLFFNSSDALVPQDGNGTEDVYEWEPAGVGGPAGCTTSVSTFNPATGGCVSLISSGTSAGESAFLDASESGNDVFFLTSEKLVSQDIDTALDVYDAHVCSSSSPCPASSAAPSECVTADACRAAPSPQPGVFGAPASATFSGSGNMSAPPPAGPKPKTAAQIRAEKRAKSLTQCHRLKKKSTRTACEKTARKRHGPLKAKKSAHSDRRGK